MELKKGKKQPEPTIMLYGKVPPQAVDFEEAVLGAILMEKPVYYLVAEILTFECFYKEEHRVIFQACSLLAARNEPVEILMVLNELKTLGKLEVAGGLVFLVRLTNQVVSTANVEFHARIIYQKYVQREVIAVSGSLLTEAHEDSANVTELLEKANTNFYRLTKGLYKKDFTTPLQNAKDAYESLAKKLQKEPGDITGLPSDFKQLDNVTSGWQPTDLIILAARPAVGKTALVLNIARNLATHKKKPTPVGFFSLEMSTGQLINRLVSTTSEIDLKQITNADLDPLELARVKEAISYLQDVPIYIDDTAALRTIEMRAKVRRMIERHGVGLIIIDYLQLMSPSPESAHKNKNDQIGEISRDLKIMAKEFNVPIIALSQLTRAVETRGEARQEPNLADLRDSGAIEQDADLVIFLYMENGFPRLRIAKHRNGSLAYISLGSNLSIQKFYDREAAPFSPIGKLKDTGNFDEGLPEAESENFNFNK